MEHFQPRIPTKTVRRRAKVYAYADRIVIRQEGETATEHRRCYGRPGDLRLVALRSRAGAQARRARTLRSRAPFKNWVLPGCRRHNSIGGESPQHPICAVWSGLERTPPRCRTPVGNSMLNFLFIVEGMHWPPAKPDSCFQIAQENVRYRGGHRGVRMASMGAVLNRWSAVNMPRSGVAAMAVIRRCCLVAP